MHLFYNLFRVKILRKSSLIANVGIPDNVTLEENPVPVELDVQSEIIRKTENELQASFQEVIKSHKSKKVQVIEFETGQKVSTLNRRLYDLEILENKIEFIQLPEVYDTDNDIDALEEILKRSKIETKLSITNSAVEKIKALWRKFDGEIDKQSTTGFHHKREVEKVKEFKKFKHDIENLQSIIDKQITQNDFSAARLSIRRIENLLSSIQKLSVRIQPGKAKENKRVVVNLSGKISDLKRKLAFKENELEKKRQEEKFKTEREEALKRQKEEEVRRFEIRKRQEQEDLELNKRQQNLILKEEERILTLNRLLTFRSDWANFERVLIEKNITKLYHFTDSANLSSIKKHGGLYSWKYCRKNDITIPVQGGDTLSRGLDEKHKLEDFVRLSFTRNHPMMYVALNHGRISNPIILEISLDVVYFENTRFSNMNAAANMHKNSLSFDFFQQLKFELFNRNYNTLSDIDKKYYQSEVLVKTWIPIQYITNINQV